MSHWSILHYQQYLFHRTYLIKMNIIGATIKAITTL